MTRQEFVNHTSISLLSVHLQVATQVHFRETTKCAIKNIPTSLYCGTIYLKPTKASLVLDRRLAWKVLYLLHIIIVINSKQVSIKQYSLQLGVVTL